MNKNKKNETELQETEVLSPEELYLNTKKTLKSYIKANTFLGFAAGLTAGVTMIAIPLVEDSKKKTIIGCSGAIATAVSLGGLAVSMKKMDAIIDNHDDSNKFKVVGQFLNAKGDEAKNNLIDEMIDDLLVKANLDTLKKGD